MSVLSRGGAWFRLLRNRRRLDDDLDREILAWVDELAARYEADGMPADEARRRALIETGGVARVKEAVRDVRVGSAVDALGRDLRYAWRSLTRARVRLRHAYRRSRPSASTADPTRTSRTASFTRATPPVSIRARRRASSAGIPSASYRAASSSTQASISRSRSS